jgi:transcriptional regulator with XRE-family HTH domain
MTPIATPTTSTLRDAVAANLRVELARRGVSATQLAYRMERGESWISRRLSGKSAITLDDLEEIAAALDIAARSLLPERTES